jgi:hypothetical protein
MSRECSICGQTLADSPFAGPAHARKHKNEFQRVTGQQPENYEEVRELFAGGFDQPTLGEFGNNGGERQ